MNAYYALDGAYGLKSRYVVGLLSRNHLQDCLYCNQGQWPVNSQAVFLKFQMFNSA